MGHPHVFQMPDCSDMRLSHVAYMQVVAHAGSVAGWVVATINGESFTYAGRRLGDVGQEVFRYAATKLTNQCRGCAPTGLKYRSATTRVADTLTQSRKKASPITLVRP